VTLPVVASWEEWGRIFTDVATWTPAVREIARRAALPVTSIEAGYPGTNAVFLVNAYAGAGADPPPYVVKIYCPFCLEDFTLEQTLHPLLTVHPDLPVPAVLGQGVLKGEMDWPYLILSFLSGDAIRDARPVISHPNLLSISRHLGRSVKALHRVPRSSFLSLEPLLGDWDVLSEQYLAKTIEHLTRNQVLPQPLIEQIPDFVTSVLSRQPYTTSVLVNGDLTEDHLLVEKEETGEWHMSGLIDFADALIAPPAYEWVALWFGALDRDRGCLQAFMESYEPGLHLDATFRRTAMAFTLLHEFGGSIMETALTQLGRPTVEGLAELCTTLW
jgi:Ser/Thr protein kinase RdoA (MazF antagonist)